MDKENLIAALGSLFHKLLRCNRSILSPRYRWDEAFRRMALKSDDVLLDAGSLEAGWDEMEWENGLYR